MSKKGNQNCVHEANGLFKLIINLYKTKKSFADKQPFRANFRLLVDSKCVLNQIRSHTQGLEAEFFGVVIDTLVFPAVA